MKTTITVEKINHSRQGFMIHKQPLPLGSGGEGGGVMDHKSLSTVVYLLHIPLLSRFLYFSTIFSAHVEYISLQCVFLSSRVLLS